MGLFGGNDRRGLLTRAIGNNLKTAGGHDKFRECREAEDAFMSSRREGHDSSMINEVKWSLDSDNDFVVVAKTFEATYAVVVILKDNLNLTWVESQALHAALVLVARGTKLSLGHFKAADDATTKFSTRLKKQGSTYVLYMADKGSRVQLRSTDIRRVALQRNRDGDLDIQAILHTGDVLQVILMLHSGFKSRLSIAECETLKIIFSFMEPGDKFPLEVAFGWAAAMLLKARRGMWVETEGRFRLALRPTIVDGVVPTIPDRLQRALRDMPERGGGGGGGGGSGGGKGAAGRIPEYPGVTRKQAIGEGGQAKVFLCDYKGKKAVLKVFADAGDVDEYKTEVKSLYKGGSHPNVVEILDFFEAPLPAIVIEYVEGGNLYEAIERRRSPWPMHEALHIIQGLASGIAHIHRAGIIHRDLKSLNVLLDTSGSQPRAVIIDLGMGKASKGPVGAGYSPTMTVNPKGTPLWMAPEMIRKAEWSDRTDIFAMGIMMWEILACKAPYSDTNFGLGKVADGSLRPTVSAVSNAPQHVRSAMVMCWDQQPSKRPSAQQLLAMLDPSTSGGASLAMDASAAFRRADTDGNGALDFSEFCRLLKDLGCSVPATRQSEVFDYLSDENDVVTSSSFSSWWSVLKRDGLEVAMVLGQKGKRAGTPIPDSPSRAHDTFAELRSGAF